MREPSLPDDKNTKVFRHAKSNPEVAPHKTKWDKSKCKRNKSNPHDMVLVKNDLKHRYDYRHFTVDGFQVWERRPYEFYDKEWRCSFCKKKEINYPWGEKHNYTADWEEYRRMKKPRP